MIAHYRNNTGCGAHAEYADNLRYFIRQGVRPDDGCEYIIVLQQDGGPQTELPELPPNARYEHHANEVPHASSTPYILIMHGIAHFPVHMVISRCNAYGPKN